MREEFIQTLVADINEWLKAIDEHELSTESGLPEYVGCLGYGDAEISLEELTDAAKALVALIPKGERRNAFLECSSVESCGIYAVTNAVFTAMHGECEFQLDGELLDRVKSLTSEEFCVFCRSIDGYVSDRHRDLFYVDHSYDGFTLVLDENRLAAWLEERGIPTKEGE